MSSYDDLYWSEVVTDDSPLERERAAADLSEWEQELAEDRLRRDWPMRCSPELRAGRAGVRAETGDAP